MSKENNTNKTTKANASKPKATNPVIKTEVKMVTTNYSIKGLKDAMITCYLDGKKFSKPNALDLGLTKIQYEGYQFRIKELFAVAKEYYKAIEDGIDVTDNKQAKTLANKVFTAWKNLLVCGNDEELNLKLRCNANDARDIANYIRTKVNTKVNVDSVKGFKTSKQWAISTLQTFTANIELELVTRFLDLGIMTDEEQNRLKELKKIVSKRDKARKELDEYKVKIDKAIKNGDSMIDGLALAEVQKISLALDEVIRSSQAKINVLKVKRIPKVERKEQTEQVTIKETEQQTA